MKIEHVAIWSPDIEVLRQFYCEHFGCVASSRYENEKKRYASYFLHFPEGARIEVMQKVGIAPRASKGCHGYAHFALSVGSEREVRALTDLLRDRGVAVCSEPRWTGDGYFESVVADPDGNEIEITI